MIQPQRAKTTISVAALVACMAASGLSGCLAGGLMATSAEGAGTTPKPGPTETVIETETVTAEPEPVESSPVAAPEPEPSAAPATDPRFRTCGKANAAGFGPYERGIDAEYRWYRDADNDGTVCES